MVNRSATSPPATAPIAPMAIKQSVPLVAEVQQILGEQHEDRRGHLHAEHRETGSDRQSTQDGVARQPAQTFADLGAQSAAHRAAPWARTPTAWSVSTSAAAIAKLAASNPKGSHIAATKKMLPSGVPMKLLAAISDGESASVGLLEYLDRHDRRNHRL